MADLKSLTVSQLIRKFNLMLDNTDRCPRLSSECKCMLRLYVHDHDQCPIHIQRTDVADDICNSLANKNILYITSEKWQTVIDDKQIQILLPLVIHIHQSSDDSYHFANKRTPLRLNNSWVTFANLLIINVLPCAQNCTSYNHILDTNKEMEFNFIIFINCNRNRPQKYIEKTDKCFKLKIGNFISSVAVTSG